MLQVSTRSYIELLEGGVGHFLRAAVLILALPAPRRKRAEKVFDRTTGLELRSREEAGAGGEDDESHGDAHFVGAPSEALSGASAPGKSLLCFCRHGTTNHAEGASTRGGYILLYIFAINVNDRNCSQFN